jgi:hypothetical protein
MNSNLLQRIYVEKKKKICGTPLGLKKHFAQNRVDHRRRRR